MNRFCYACLLLVLVGTFGCQPDSTDTASQAAASADRAAVAALAAPRFTVQAPSGLNYRAAPQGDALGKFADGDTVRLIRHSGVFDELMDAQKARYGEWVQVQRGDSSGYVFDAYLAAVPPKTPTGQAALRPPFPLETYHKAGEKEFVYVPLSGAYSWRHQPDSILIDSAYLGDGDYPPYHYLEGEKRRLFLRRMRIQPDELLIIYDYLDDQLYRYPVKDLPLLAHVNTYSGGKTHQHQDYVIGLSLEDKWQAHTLDELTNSFAVIDSQSPFARGQLHPLRWEPVAPTQFPPVPLDSTSAVELASHTATDVFHAAAPGLHCYVRVYQQPDPRRDWEQARHYVVQSEQGVVLDQVEYLREGDSFADMTMTGDSAKYCPFQWMGKLYQKAPPVLFGLRFISFDCPWMYLLDGSGQFLRIACDNHH